MRHVKPNMANRPSHIFDSWPLPFVPRWKTAKSSYMASSTGRAISGRHYVLATVGETGVLRYQDTTTGQIVAAFRSKLGACDAMRQNPANAIIHLGHSNGTVSLWSPNMVGPHMWCSPRHRMPQNSRVCAGEAGGAGAVAWGVCVRAWSR
jgi:hypothetical protein